MKFAAVWFAVVLGRIACVVVVVFCSLFLLGLLFRSVSLCWKFWKRKTVKVPQWVSVEASTDE